jgi:predicted ATPase
MLLLGVLDRLAARGALLLVVEDLHWADQSTRDLLGFLVRNLRAGVALLLTYRSDELHRRHPLRPFLGELDRGGRAERLELGRLGRRELGELLAGILGAPAPAALAREIMNRQIAQALFISDRTASVHVSNILAKLGVANRAEAAATVHPSASPVRAPTLLTQTARALPAGRRAPRFPPVG